MQKRLRTIREGLRHIACEEYSKKSKLLNSEVATGHCGQVEGIPRTVVRLT
jgi:hypothetical protein